MNKFDYIKAKNDLIARLGPPVYDEIDTRKPVNESAKELQRLFSAYQSSKVKERHQANKVNQEESKQKLLTEVEQKQVVNKYKALPALPFDLSEQDLEPFTIDERNILCDYFHNTNLSPSELERPGFSRQRIVALMRSGPFQVLSARVFDHLLPLEVRNAVLKGIRAGEKSLVERFAEHTGVLKDQTLNLNVNKPIEDEALKSKLKALGDDLE